MSEWRILGPEERKLLGDEYITRYARAAGLDAWAAATPEVLDMVNKTPVLNNEFRFRRRVSPVANNATTDKESLTVEAGPHCSVCYHHYPAENLLEATCATCWKQLAEKAEALQSNCNSALKIAIEMLEETKAKLEQAEKERDQLRAECEERRIAMADIVRDLGFGCDGLEHHEIAPKVRQLRAENERLKSNSSKLDQGVSEIVEQALAAKGETK